MNLMLMNSYYKIFDYVMQIQKWYNDLKDSRNQLHCKPVT